MIFLKARSADHCLKENNDHQEWLTNEPTAREYFDYSKLKKLRYDRPRKTTEPQNHLNRKIGEKVGVFIEEQIHPH
ncbi:MAG: hypothetical protein JEZ10_02225 [Verrucomicrobia bacterium]|nr:hypothetical protein [Verrucomicrobiota bacterium]